MNSGDTIQNGNGVYTAAQVAAALGITPRAVRKALLDTPATTTRIVSGNEAAAWSVASLPASLRERLESEVVKRQYRNIEAMLSCAPKQWDAPLPIDKICDADIKYAQKLRNALQPWLSQQHDLRLSAAELEARGVADHHRFFGDKPITRRYWRLLFKRTLKRDGGAEDWTRLELYLPANPKVKQTPARMVSDAIADVFGEIEDFIGGFKGSATAQQKRDIWVMALIKYTALAASMTPKRAARLVRSFLFARAPFLAVSRDALLKAFNYKLEVLKKANGDLKALGADGRSENGDEFIFPAEDIRRGRWSSGLQNGSRVDATWREQYGHFSAETRKRYPYSQRAPRTFHKQVNREMVDALHARHQGKRTLRRIIGGIEREWKDVPSMTRWVLDDVTSNIETAGLTPYSLMQPQVVVAMDSAARKIVGWAASDDKGPTAKLSCEAVLDGFRRYGVPKELVVENGFVFGKSLNINGKSDEQGRSVVAGLARYGCEVRHFERMNPTGKSELEKSFDLLQQRMDRHPGYGGRNQMIDAPEDFKREQRLILSEKAEATEYRYTFKEFVVVLEQIIADYNAKPQDGHLQGLSPNDAFELFKEPGDPHIEFTPEIEWLLANEHYLVTVELGGVRIKHYGRDLRVRGGRIANFKPGTELWALVDRHDDSLVTFMNLNFTDPFTMEVCQKPSACERLMAAGSGVLASERAKVREHERAIDEQYKDLVQEFGNPRRDLLLAARGQGPEVAAPARQPIVPKRLAESAKEMKHQRQELRAGRVKTETRDRTTQDRARKLGLPMSILNDGPERGEGLALMLAAKREHERKKAIKSALEESL